MHREMEEVVYQFSVSSLQWAALASVETWWIEQFLSHYHKTNIITKQNFQGKKPKSFVQY